MSLLVRLVGPLIFAVFVAGIDQMVKLWLKVLLLAPQPHQINVTSFFDLTPAWNYGVSFSLFYDRSAQNAWMLAGVSVVITLLLIVWLARAQSAWLRAGLGLVIGGAVGNLIDRLRFGAVFDFLDVHVMGYHWPAFNVADSAICVGVGLILIDAVRGQAQKPAVSSS